MMLQSSGQSAGDYVPQGSETMSPAMRTAHNYYAWIAAQFAPVLGQRVLDIGGGLGSHLDHVIDGSRFVTSVDLSAACVADMNARMEGMRFEARAGDITDPTFARDLVSLNVDTILCINVLEHIEQDDVALQNMAEILAASRGVLFLLVPAHPFLYGTPDALAGHVRRYARRRLRDALEQAGFAIQRLYHFNWFGAVPYLLNARVLRPKTLGGSVDTQITLFDRYFVPVLRRVESVVRMPFGQSLIAIARVGGS